ncbi:hypothetical protein [Azomonas macrocytogenes]|uniref:Uncharacterized protein n=1 Tax=Azomonas macrocytogenes TaxID=69962 RepID=A0A839T1F5_AZOMA|nr:hypothetical protein [Azomonas macrocytogenes]MBB3102938.1 hypothetical protein [Azomonas macrocytogenes]
MSHRFSPGDLAMTLVSLKQHAAGSVVELEKKVEAGRVVRELSTRKLYLVKASAWICTRADEQGRFVYEEKNLMPLSGTPSQANETEEDPRLPTN